MSEMNNCKNCTKEEQIRAEMVKLIAERIEKICYNPRASAVYYSILLGEELNEIRKEYKVDKYYGN